MLEGDKIAKEVLRQAKFDVAGLYALPAWLEANHILLQNIDSESIIPVSENELTKISGLATPNQVLLIARQPQYDLANTSISGRFTLFLDAIQDPGNMGTILRIADWFGLPAVLCSPDCADVFSPKVVQASMGALLRVPTIETTLPEVHRQYPDLPLLGAVLDGENVFQVSLPTQGILIIGNESRGIDSALQPLLTQRIAIPPAAGGGAESLNAAVATGILVALLTNRQYKNVV
ncbi:MAG TPA: RNA methyltransferase [Saprospiraceae bacterium]|nr:RNA methyltransferase [Saprospiraceae bacterium]